ncbi:MAG: GTPase ObgE [Phycisphaeraceae bacterium]|nr:GTPase ObgE [Phycisphaeraceae bacterium]
MLIDQAVIFVRSGKGGDGAVSFRREKFVPKGGPDGGDGGNGGDVMLVATAGVDTLLDFTGRHHWFAEEGGAGAHKQQHGKNGEHLIIKVPPGTLVYNDTTGELIADLDSANKTLVAAKGGRGGFGNEHFKSATHQTPRTASPGEPAVELTLRLELKMIADVGLIGMPNAGKSTLLSVVTRARPKIANYPFTTLEPNLGIAELPGEPLPRRLILADIPGLIEGASEGHGLGTEFLRHVERTSVLVHLVECDSVEGDPVHNYRVIRQELAGYSPELASKREIVALSKMDLLGTNADRQAAVQMVEEELGLPVVALSAASGEGVTALLEQCWQQVSSLKGTP